MISAPRAAIELSLAGAIWGFGFVAAIWALPNVGPFWQSAIRFSLSALVILPFVRPSRGDWRDSALPGLSLSAAILVQTWGLAYTSATKAGFLTSLYVVFVPIAEYLFLRKRVSLTQLVCVFVALVGTALVSGLGTANVDLSWNRGDTLILICSLLCTVQIIAIGRVAERITRPLAFHGSQVFWGSLLCLPIALLFEQGPTPVPTWSGKAVFGLAMLTFASTLVGFMIQVRAQRRLSPLTASLIFLLEAPFAACFGKIFLNEELGALQWMGATLILAACVGVTLAPARQSSGPTLA